MFVSPLVCFEDAIIALRIRSERSIGFNLPAKYVIHAVGPQVENKNPSKSDQQTLRNVYQNALGLAKSKGLRSIAFPTISTGIYGYPKRQVGTGFLNHWKLDDHTNDNGRPLKLL